MKYKGSVENTVKTSRYSYAAIIGLLLVMHGMLIATFMGH